MPNFENAAYFWEIMAGVGFVFAWFVRLEMRVMWVERSHKEKKEFDDGNNRDLWAKMNEISTALARIEGKLDLGR